MARRRYGSRGNEGQQSREKKIIRRIFEMSIQQGYSPSRIAVTLNEEKMLALTEGVPWSEQQITRILDHPSHATLKKKLTEEHERQQRIQQNPNAEIYYLPGRSYWSKEEGRYIHEMEEVPVTKAEFDAEMERLEHVTKQASEAAKLEYSLLPFHFIDPADQLSGSMDDLGKGKLHDPSNEDLDASADIGRLGLSGHDTWFHGPISELVKEQTQRTGKDAHELLSRIEGNASEKGQLRRCLWGILRELALQRQANLALRQQLGQGEALQRRAVPEPAVETTFEESAQQFEEEEQRERKRLADERLERERGF